MLRLVWRHQQWWSRRAIKWRWRKKRFRRVYTRILLNICRAVDSIIAWLKCNGGGAQKRLKKKTEKSPARCSMVAPETSHFSFNLNILSCNSFHHRRLLSRANFFRNHFRCCTHLPNATKCEIEEEKNSWKWIAFRFSPVYFPHSLRFDLQSRHFSTTSEVFLSFSIQLLCPGWFLSFLAFAPIHTHTSTQPHISVFWISFKNDRFEFIALCVRRRV